MEEVGEGCWFTISFNVKTKDHYIKQADAKFKTNKRRHFFTQGIIKLVNYLLQGKSDWTVSWKGKKNKPWHWEILFIKLAPLVEELGELQIPSGKHCPCSLHSHPLPHPFPLAPVRDELLWWMGFVLAWLTCSMQKFKPGGLKFGQSTQLRWEEMPCNDRQSYLLTGPVDTVPMVLDESAAQDFFIDIIFNFP